MRIVFAGTPAFAATGLQAIVDAGHEVPLVLSQPDRPAGRGMQRQPGAVSQLARARGIPVLTPASLRPERGGAAAIEALERLRAADADFLVVAAYGLLLPEAVLAIARGRAVGAAGGGIAAEPVRAINIHASLLPRWRGAAPIVRAIEAGDARTGITIMQMDAGLDTGPMLLCAALDIAPDETAGALTQRLALLGGTLVVRALDDLQHRRLQARAQPADGVLYAHKVAKREAWIDWQQPAERLAARVRAFDPFPGACSSLDGLTIKVWQALAVPAAAGAAPGSVLGADAAGVLVACGAGALRLTRLQRPGGRRLDARDFLAGTPIAPGQCWSTPVDGASGREP